MLAYTVAQRTGEIGIRMALGAQRGPVIRLVLSDGMRLVVFGLGGSLAAAALMARLIESQLFAVEPFDPLVYGGIAVLFALIAAAACILPALRRAGMAQRASPTFKS